MKDRKKPKGTKARVKAYKKRLQHISTSITVAILIAIIATSGFLIYSHLNPSSNQTTSSTFQLKAAIVDHLSLTQPNQTFIQTATSTLEKAGFTVDYYPGEEVTIGFYRDLPTHGYGLIVLRVHSALKLGEKPPVCLFTSQPYSEMKYTYEQLDGQVGIVAFLPYHEGDPLYFGIGPKFVRRSMNGRFENTIIIMMGCDGLAYTTMAEAFIGKGARVYISWNGGVLAAHTDLATTHLLQHLITEKQTISQAVTETMKEVGPDPIDNSILQYYPTEAGGNTYDIRAEKKNQDSLG